MTPLHHIRLILAIAILPLSATAEEFPFAKGTFENNKLQQWTIEKVRKHRDEAIGDLKDKTTIPDKDNAADPGLLGYKSNKVEGISVEKERYNEENNIIDPEAVIIKTVLDLTTVNGLVYFAIQVDDQATLTVKEIPTGDEPTGYTPITKTYEVKGTALWRVDRSYKEFPDSIPAGRKYDLKLNYRNTANLTDKYDGKTDFDGVNVFLISIPVEVIELSPKLIDEDGKIILNSEKPAVTPDPNELVERDPFASPEPLNDASAIRIAWRDMRVKIGKPWAGKKITWSMTPLFIPSVVNSGDSSEILMPDPTGARFRGSWAHAAEATNRDAFSSSMAYEKHEWKRGAATSDSVPGTATTTVDAEGYTAIRVNLPPVGFNKAKIKIKIEGIASEIDLIDFVVPAVVVIDPGHGGALADGKKGGSSPNNAFSYGSAPAPSDSEKPRKSSETMAEYRAGLDAIKSGETQEEYWARLSVTLEKDMGLQYGIDLRSALHALFDMDSSKVRILMTKSKDTNIPISSRANVAKVNGADIFFSIHYNSNTRDWVRGPEIILRSEANGNINLKEDLAFADRIQSVLDARVPDAPVKVENPNYKDELPDYRGIKQYADHPTGVDNDSSLGNPEAGPCSHACLAEIEFITATSVEQSLVSGATSADIRRSLCQGFATAIRNDIHARKAER